MQQWIGFYGAALSTIIATISVIRWLVRIRLTVYALHPYETWSQSCEAVVVNSGSRPTSVRKVIFEAFERRFFKGDPVWRVVADSAHIMDPSVKKEPVPGKENTYKRVPNVLNAGEEYVGAAKPSPEFKPDVHWLRVSAYARGRRMRFSNWAEPRGKEGI